MNGTIKINIKFSGSVFVGPAEVFVEKNWPRATTQIRIPDLVEAIAGACRKHGVKGVTVQVRVVNRYGVESLRGEHLQLVISFPKSASIYRMKLILSEQMFTREVPLIEFKRPVQNLLSKYGLGGAACDRFKFLTFAGVSEGIEVEV